MTLDEIEARLLRGLSALYFEGTGGRARQEEQIAFLIRAVRQLAEKLGKERIEFMATTGSIDADVLALLEEHE